MAAEYSVQAVGAIVPALAVTGRVVVITDPGVLAKAECGRIVPAETIGLGGRERMADVLGVLVKEIDLADRAKEIGPAGRAITPDQIALVKAAVANNGGRATGPIIVPIGFPIATAGTTGGTTIARTFGTTGITIGTTTGTTAITGGTKIGGTAGVGDIRTTPASTTGVGRRGQP